MKERPILFSGPMVRAILDGRKTQTRRWLMDSKLPDGLEEYEMSDLRLRDGFLEGRKNESAPWAQMVHGQGRAPECAGIPTRCPYGEPGDRLWVKETWRTRREWDRIAPSKLPVTEDSSFTPLTLREQYITYVESDTQANKLRGKLRPSIYMPRWASRITLEIVGVRVERLQDISDEDSEAEGVNIIERVSTGERTGAKVAFRTLWKSINGPDSWQANPWVWVVQFGRVEQ